MSKAFAGQPDTRYPRAAPADWSGELGGHAVHGANAYLRRRDSSWRCARSRHPDGRYRRRRFIGSLDAGFQNWRERTGTLGGDHLREFRDQSVYFFFLEIILVVGRAFDARRLFDDVADGLFEHTDSNHGARSIARPCHGSLFDDVYGDGALWSFMGGALAHHIGAPATLAVGGLACIFGAIWFGRALPAMRIEARYLIIAQAWLEANPSRS